MADILANCVLSALGDVLEAEANARVDNAMLLLSRCKEEVRHELLASVGLSPNAAEAYVRDYLDTLDLLDDLEPFVVRIEEQLKLAGLCQHIVDAVQTQIGGGTVQ
jgi:hypothetical protein